MIRSAAMSSSRLLLACLPALLLFGVVHGGSPGPTPVMTIPTECKKDTPEFRWASSTGLSGRMYADGKGCFTMTDLYMFQQGVMDDDDDQTFAERSKGPIYVLTDKDRVDYYPDAFTGRWLLESDLFVTGGGTFYCKGKKSGGNDEKDCDVLRIRSNGPKDYHEIRGHGGNLYFEDTLVTSWDTDKREVQETYEKGRSFINCVSEKKTGCGKNDMGECRMDIIDSEMGYMGFFDTESYGLTWKVRGFCSDKSNPEIFDKVDVFGDIKGSDIHHMYYGMYSYGHQGGDWTDNKMHDNIVYGFDPHDDSDYLTISHNEVYDNHLHGIIASKRCNNVEISFNVVYDGGYYIDSDAEKPASGIFLHRSSDRCKVHHNKIYNIDAGITLHESFDCEVYHNEIRDTEYGIRLVVGAGDNDVHDNEIEGTDVGLTTDRGSDDAEVGDGRPLDNIFRDNKVSDTNVAVKLKYSESIVVKDNNFADTKTIEFNDAQDTTWKDNKSPDACKSYGDSTFNGDLPSAC